MPPFEDDDDQSLTDLAGLLASDKEGVIEGSDVAEQPATDDGDQPQTGDPDEGTGEPEEPEEGGDDPEAATGEEPSTEPFYTVKIDGKDEKVTLKEALAGYQREQDYTRKTMEVAEARKAVDNEVAAVRQTRDQYAAVLKLVQERLGPADQEPTAEQWNALRQADPGRYATEYADYQRRQDQRRAVAAEQYRVAEENRQQDLKKAQTYLETERAKLVQALPVLADRDKAPAELKALREYAAKTFGYSEQEMDQAYDHRMIIAIDKARKWDTHQATLAAAKKKVAEAPALPAPGPRVPGNSTKSAARAALQKKFDRTGNPEDAAALLLA